MRRLLLGLVFLLAGAASAFGQSTTVSGNVTDAGSQAWAGGTLQFQFVPNPQFPTGPYTWTGGALNNVIPGVLDGSGNYSVSIPSSTAISPQGSKWILQVTPNATSPSFSTAATTITGGTQTLNATPPAVTISPSPVNRAYADGEVTGAIIGSEYFNTTTSLVRVCTAVTSGACSTWANVGAGVAGGAVGAAGDCQFALGAGGAFTNMAGTGGGTCNAASGFWAVGTGAGGLNQVFMGTSSGGVNANASGSALSLSADAALSINSNTGNIAISAAAGTGQIQFGSSNAAHLTDAGALTVTSCTGCGGGTAAFSALTGGTNTTAAMLVGTGASLGVLGSGTINATTLGGATFAAPGPIGSTTPSTGAFSTLSATGQITSTLATGTAPFVVASTTNVANLNASSLGGATFAAPGAIGGTTPAAGTFTTLTGRTSVTAGVVGTTAGVVNWSGSTSGTFTSTVNATASALTNSGILFAPDGGTSNPSYSFTNCTNCGLSQVAGQLVVSGGATLHIAIGSTEEWQMGTTFFQPSTTEVQALGAQSRSLTSAFSDYYQSAGTKFTASGCSNTTTVGGASAGSFLSGTTGACTVTITMGHSSTATNGWSCAASDLTTPANLISQSATTTTSCTVTGTTVSGDKISFLAMAY